MLALHADYAPGSRYVATETVPVTRLDTASAEEVRNARSPFLKIDTQGYEATVLSGAGSVMDMFVGVELEMSLVPLYEGQTLLHETLDLMRGFGFRLAAVSPGLVDDTNTGETLQVDGTFLRIDR